ncbi:hypothetical protein AUC31_01705 [Planococcus rifietoensis]|uniref:Uncharacterized protein n=1 Tax=Planococcus rifietoensis TaxID=200991 RepID=A0A0U2Z4G5_9BACL|nr:hypothetical protein AUC31_01705 [Planococcus rifietoensis]
MNKEQHLHKEFIGLCKSFNKEFRIILSLDDYLKIYTKSSIDGYRRTENHGKDLRKIDIIKKIKEANQ